MSTSNEQLLSEYLDAYNERDWDRLGRCVAADYVHHDNDTTMDLTEFVASLVTLRRGLPDLRIEIETTVTEANQAAVRWVGRATHLGSVYGEEPTGRSVVLHGISMFRFRDGKIAEDWEVRDRQYLLSQLSMFGGPIELG